MPLIPPVPGGPPQGSHRSLEEKQKEQQTSAASEEALKVSRIAGQEGSVVVQNVPREKLASDLSWLFRLSNWVSGLIRAVFRTKKAEQASSETAQALIQPKADIRARFQALPAAQQRQFLEKMLATFKEEVDLGQKGLFREEGNSITREELKEKLVKQLERSPSEEIKISPADLKELSAAFKTFLGAYLNHTLPIKGYEALKRGGSQEEILDSMAGEDRVFLESFFEFYRKFAARQMENEAMDQRGVAVVFAPSFTKDNDNPFAVVAVGKALMDLLPQAPTEEL